MKVRYRKGTGWPVEISDGKTATCISLDAAKELQANLLAVIEQAENDASEEELTEFENRLCEILDSAINYQIHSTHEETIEDAKKLAPELLELARKELCESGEVTDWYAKGKAEALKDLPRWKEYNTPGMSKGELSLTLYSGVYEVSDLFIDKGLYIPISDLEKLPKDE